MRDRRFVSRRDGLPVPPKRGWSPPPHASLASRDRVRRRARARCPRRREERPLRRDRGRAGGTGAADRARRLRPRLHARRPRREAPLPRRPQEGEGDRARMDGARLPGGHGLRAPPRRDGANVRRAGSRLHGRREQRGRVDRRVEAPREGRRHPLPGAPRSRRLARAEALGEDHDDGRPPRRELARALSRRARRPVRRERPQARRRARVAEGRARRRAVGEGGRDARDGGARLPDHVPPRREGGRDDLGHLVERRRGDRPRALRGVPPRERRRSVPTGRLRRRLVALGRRAGGRGPEPDAALARDGSGGEVLERPAPLARREEDDPRLDRRGRARGRPRRSAEAAAGPPARRLGDRARPTRSSSSRRRRRSPPRASSPTAS